MKKILIAIALLGAAGTASAIPVEWTIASGGNGHFYDFVDVSLTWDEALADAATKSTSGWVGYLATVTSDAENTFISSRFGALGWLGGSDHGAANVNDWSWRTGPETGQPFVYSHWNPSEPNDCCGGEDYLQLNWSVTGGWNDHGGPGNAGQRNGYFVEFSAPPVPEPETYALMLAGLGIVGAAIRNRKTRS